MSYEPYSIEVDPDDLGYEDWTLAEVTPYKDGSSWSVLNDRSTGCGVPALKEGMFSKTLREPIEPKVGDTLRVYGSLGREIQGQVLNGVVLWYRTKEQQKAHRRRWLEDNDAQRQRQFLLERDHLDAQYEALSTPFKRRIDRFRAEDPKFRADSEGYEAFCCQQADLLIKHFGNIEKIKAWNAINSDGNDPPYDYETQRKLGPEGWSDGHSGNTHAASIGLACRVLEGGDV